MSDERRYDDYDALAWFYDRYWGDRFPRAALPVLDDLVLRSLPAGARVLDLCCGAGHVTAELARRGFRVVGVDGSEEMLGYARRRLPSVEFVCADARSFDVGANFDLVLSTFDSMNHVTETDDLAAVFRRALAALKPGGRFVFDMNMEEAYSNEWGKSSAIVEHDNACIIRGGYDERTKRGRTEVTMFRMEADAVWRRSDVRLIQRCYAPAEIERLLADAGFGEVERYDARRDLRMTDDLATGRDFFVATRD